MPTLASARQQSNIAPVAPVTQGQSHDTSKKVRNTSSYNVQSHSHLSTRLQVLLLMSNSSSATRDSPRPLSGRLSARWLAVLPPLGAVLYVHWGWLTSPSGLVAGDLNFWGWLEGTQHWYWHIAHDLLNGVSPFTNNFKAFPDGNNHLMLHGNFGDALVAAPFQWLFDFPLSYNLAVALFTALNAYGLYRLARVFTDQRLVASLASCLVVFHPYLLTQLEQGRLTQYLVGWAFLALAEAALIMRDESRGIRRLVVYWVATFVSFWFYGVFLSFFLAAWVLIATRRLQWVRRRPFLKALGWTVLFSIPFGLPLVLQALSGSGIPGVTLLTPPVPGTRWVTAAHPEDILWFQATEFGPVVLPMTMLVTAAIAIVGGWTGGKENPGRDVAALALCAAGAWLLALGPFLVSKADGIAMSTSIPLPWYLLYMGVPFFSRLSYPVMVFPFLLVGALGLSLVAIRTLSSVLPHSLLRRWIPVATLALILVELVLRVPADLIADPFAVPDPYRWLATQEEADALLEYPFGYTDCSRIYQPFHGKCLMGSEGRFEDLREWAAVDDLFGRSPALARLAAVQLGEEPLPIPVQELEALYQEGFDYLVFRPIRCGHQEMSEEWVVRTRVWLEEILGPPFREADGVVLFKLPAKGTQHAVCGQSVR